MYSNNISEKKKKSIRKIIFTDIFLALHSTTELVFCWMENNIHVDICCGRQKMCFILFFFCESTRRSTISQPILCVCVCHHERFFVCVVMDERREVKAWYLDDFFFLCAPVVLDVIAPHPGGLNLLGAGQTSSEIDKATCTLYHQYLTMTTRWQRRQQDDNKTLLLTVWACSIRAERSNSEEWVAGEGNIPQSENTQMSQPELRTYKCPSLN